MKFLKKKHILLLIYGIFSISIFAQSKTKNINAVLFNYTQDDIGKQPGKIADVKAENYFEISNIKVDNIFPQQDGYPVIKILERLTGNKIEELGIKGFPSSRIYVYSFEDILRVSFTIKAEKLINLKNLTFRYAALDEENATSIEIKIEGKKPSRMMGSQGTIINGNYNLSKYILKPQETAEIIIHCFYMKDKLGKGKSGETVINNLCLTADYIEEEINSTDMSVIFNKNSDEKKNFLVKFPADQISKLPVSSEGYNVVFNQEYQSYNEIVRMLNEKHISTATVHYYLKNKKNKFYEVSDVTYYDENLNKRISLANPEITSVNTAIAIASNVPKKSSVNNDVVENIAEEKSSEKQNIETPAIINFDSKKHIKDPWDLYYEKKFKNFIKDVHKDIVVLEFPNHEIGRRDLIQFFKVLNSLIGRYDKGYSLKIEKERWPVDRQFGNAWYADCVLESDSDIKCSVEVKDKEWVVDFIEIEPYDDWEYLENLHKEGLFENELYYYSRLYNSGTISRKKIKDIRDLLFKTEEENRIVEGKTQELRNKYEAIIRPLVAERKWDYAQYKYKEYKEKYFYLHKNNDGIYIRSDIDNDPLVLKYKNLKERQLEEEKQIIEEKRLAEESRVREIRNRYTPIVEQNVKQGDAYVSKKQFCYALGYYHKAYLIEQNNKIDFGVKEKFEALKNSILDGKPGNGEYDDFEKYDGWIALLKESEKYFTENPPFVLKPENLEVVSKDMQKRTYVYGFYVSQEKSDEYGVYEIIKGGLSKARDGDWVDVPRNWPEKSIYWSENHGKDYGDLGEAYKAKTTYKINDIPLCEVTGLLANRIETLKKGVQFAEEMGSNYTGAYGMGVQIGINNKKESLNRQIENTKKDGINRIVKVALVPILVNFNDNFLKMMYEIKFNIVDENQKIILAGENQIYRYDRKYEFNVSSEVAKKIQNGTAKVMLDSVYVHYGMVDSEDNSSDAANIPKLPKMKVNIKQFTQQDSEN